MRLKILLVLCMLFLVGSVDGFTSCPSDAEFEDTIKSAIVNYFANPNEENLNILKDLVVFYSTHDLSTADCSEEGKNSGTEIQEIYSSIEESPIVTKEVVTEGVIDMILAVDGVDVYDTVLLVDDEPSSYSGSSGDYELKVLDNVGNVLWSQNFKLSYMYNESLSDSVFDVLGYKIPYNSSMFEVRLYKKGDNIFSKQLSFCNNNGVCDYDSETFYSCPSDCAEPVLKGPVTGAVTGAASASGSSGIAYRKASWYWQATFDYFVNIQYSDDKINWHNALPSCIHVRFRESMDKQSQVWADVGAHKYWALYVCGTGGTPPLQIWEMDWFTHDGTNYVEKNPTADEISFEGTYTSFNPANLIDNNLNTLGLQRNQPGTSTARMIISKGELQPKMKILFIPVNWGIGEDNFNRLAQEQANFFKNHLPTECSDEVGVDWRFTNCELNEASFCGDCRGWRGDKPAADVLKNIKDCANKAHYKYNYIVGLMDHHYNCPGEDGLGYSCGKKAVIVSELSDQITSAHELGHEFGLNDEYNKFIAEEWDELWGLWNPNPLSIEYGCDSSSNCKGELCCCGVKSGIETLPNCTKTPKYNACCLGNKNDAGGRSIMSFSDIPNDYNMIPRAFEKSCLDRIKGDKGLKCT